ncbi:GtrA family protein [Spartinivicinus marinus]
MNGYAMTDSAVLIKTFSKFIGIGVIATLIQYIGMIFFIEFGEFSQTLSSALSFAISAIFNYLLSYSFTFRASSRHSTSLIKFSIVALSGLVLNTAIFYLVKNNIAIHYIFSQCIATAAVLLWNFYFNLKWTFK